MLKKQPGYVDKGKKNIEDLINLVADLRSEEGCNWDKAQTHDSIRECLVEETAETLDALDILSEKGYKDCLKEELGDLLFQILLHSQMAKEEGLFDFDDVVDGIASKMIRRHPHVFGKPEVDSEGKAILTWKEIKAKEKEGRLYVESEQRKEWRKDCSKQFLEQLATHKDK